MTLRPLMTSFPRKGPQVRDRPLTPFEEDRTPVYAHTLSTLDLTLSPGDDAIAALIGASGLNVAGSVTAVCHSCVNHSTLTPCPTRARTSCIHLI